MCPTPSSTAATTFTFAEDMRASTSDEFEKLMPTAGFSFDDFGDGTEADVENLKKRRL